MDTVIYLLAMVRNLKEKTYKHIQFHGNTPSNLEARKIIDNSGFFNYVNSSIKKIESKSNNIQILTGTKVDPIVPKEICQFVQKACDKGIQFTFDLYAVLIELINNTIQHAYISEGVFLVNEWYLYVEDIGSELIFTFLDTGEGIPRTVNKKFSESLKVFNINKDSMFIKTALEGKQRTQTKAINRGKGLPRVVEACTKGNLKDMNIYSGKGNCLIDDRIGDNIICRDLDEEFYGTLFKWKIIKTVEED